MCIYCPENYIVQVKYWVKLINDLRSTVLHTYIRLISGGRFAFAFLQKLSVPHDNALSNRRRKQVIRHQSLILNIIKLNDIFLLLRGGFCLFLWSYFMFLLSSLAKGKQQITDIHHLVLWGYIQTSKITLLRSVELEADSLTAEETRAEPNWAIFWVLMVTFKRKI